MRTHRAISTLIAIGLAFSMMVAVPIFAGVPDGTVLENPEGSGNWVVYGGLVNDGVDAYGGSDATPSVTIESGASIGGFPGIGVNTTNGNYTVTNNGTIGRVLEGIRTDGGNDTVINNGSIWADFYGINMTGDNAYVENNSPTTIIAGEDGVYITGDNAEVYNPGFIMADDDGITVYGGHATIENSGTIDAGGDAIFVYGGHADITNTATGLLYGGLGGGMVTAIYVDGDDAAIVNDGQIFDFGYGGIGVYGGHADITNTGDITAYYGDGISVYGGYAAIENSGLIRASGDAIAVYGDNADITNTDTGILDSGGKIKVAIGAIYVEGNEATVTNDGTIYEYNKAGIYVAGENADVTNSGDIYANYVDSYGIYVYGGYAGVLNSGTINASLDAIFVEGDNATITNAEGGLLYGGGVPMFFAVAVDGDNARIENAGDIVDFGAGGINVRGDDADITNAGGIDALGYEAIGISVRGDFAVVENSDTGIITAGNDGIGISIKGDNPIVTNAGLIVTEGEAISITGPTGGGSVLLLFAPLGIGGGGGGGGGDPTPSASPTVVNSGTIIVSGDEVNAIRITGNDADVTNTMDGIIISEYGGGIKVQGDDAEIDNYGVINVGAQAGIAADDNAMITNYDTGRIFAGDAIGIKAGENATIENYGDITSDKLGIQVRGDNARIDNYGSINAGGDAINVNGDNAAITNHKGATLTGSNSISVEAIRVIGNDAMIVNDGIIFEFGDAGIYIDGYGGTVNNAGSIFSETGDGIYIEGYGGTIINSGVIEAGGDAIAVLGDNADITNTATGLLVGGLAGGLPAAVYVAGANAVIQNDGEIYENSGYGITVSGSNARIINNGIITATDAAQGAMNVSGGSDNQVLNGVDGWLFGNVTITGGNFTNNGVLFPGMPSGSYDGRVYVSGDFVSGPDSIYGVYVGAANATSMDATRIDVGGTATLNGTVQVTALGFVDTGANYTILTSGGVTNFADVIDTAVLDYSLNVTGNDVYLQVDRLSYADAVGGGAGRTPNQVILSGVLDRILGDPDFADALLSFDNMSTAQLLQALNEISSEPFADLMNISFNTINLYRSTILERLKALQLAGDGGIGLDGYRTARTSMTSGGPALASVPAPARTGSGWGGWVELYRNDADQDKDGGFFGFEAGTSGFALGFDREITDNLVLGFGGGVASSTIDFDVVDTEIDVQTYHLSLYGTYTMDRLFVDASLIFGNNEYDSTRNLGVLGVAKASHDADDLSIYLGAGYNMDVGAWRLVPNVALEYLYHDEDGFAETGAGPFNLVVDSYDEDSFTGRLGVKLARVFDLQKVKLQPEFSAQWVRVLSDPQVSVSSRFAGSPVQFKIDGLDPDRDSAVLGASLTAQFDEAFYVYADFETELRSNYDAQMWTLGVRWDF